jgi:hypothetical protein
MVGAAVVAGAGTALTGSASAVDVILGNDTSPAKKHIAKNFDIYNVYIYLF